MTTAVEARDGRDEENGEDGEDGKHEVREDGGKMRQNRTTDRTATPDRSEILIGPVMTRPNKTFPD